MPLIQIQNDRKRFEKHSGLLSGLEPAAGIQAAALDGARTRFRAVMMTAISFIFGVMPLATATGAGAVSRQIIGTTVFSGMTVATLVGIVFIPALYKWLQTMSEWTGGKKT